MNPQGMQLLAVTLAIDHENPCLGLSALFSLSKRKTPPKAGFFGFSLGVLPCFHSEEKPSSRVHHECRLALCHLFAAVS